MAYFIGNIIPAAYARLVRFFTAKPEYMTFTQGSEIYPILAKSADLMDNGAEDLSDTQYVQIPLTGVDGIISPSTLSLSAGEKAIIAPSMIPSNADVTPEYTCTFTDDKENVDVVTVAPGTDDDFGKFIVTAANIGTATITLGIDGTSFTKDFEVEVVA